MKPRALFRLVKAAFQEWQDDDASRLAASLAYYTVFSLAPLLIIAIAIAGAVFGEEAARGQLVGQIEQLVGSQGAQAIETAIQNADRPQVSSIASIISVFVLLFGASGVFAQLQDALNIIWEVKPKPGRGIMGFVRKRLLSFTAVLGIGFLLLVSLIISAVLAGITAYLSGLIPGAGYLWQVLNFIVSFVVVTLLFALIYKFLPDVKISWGDVWVGAILTAFLFVIGKFALGFYLGRGSFGSVYGAAGSLVILLAWVYYSAQILFFGAELTQVYARRRGSQIVPNEQAMRVEEEVQESDERTRE